MIVTDLFESRQTCPECGGPAFNDLLLAEKQDACYHKVRSRYQVWPSAYASGALVQCRKKGAANWGNKSKTESVAEGTDTEKDVLSFGKHDFRRWKSYAEQEGYEIREAGTLPGSYAAYSNGKQVGYFMNEFDLPNEHERGVVGRLLVSPAPEEDIAEGTEPGMWVVKYWDRQPGNDPAQREFTSKPAADKFAQTLPRHYTVAVRPQSKDTRPDMGESVAEGSVWSSVDQKMKHHSEFPHTHSAAIDIRSSMSGEVIVPKGARLSALGNDNYLNLDTGGQPFKLDPAGVVKQGVTEGLFDRFKKKPKVQVVDPGQFPEIGSDIVQWMADVVEYWKATKPEKLWFLFCPSSGDYLPMRVTVGTSSKTMNQHMDAYRRLRDANPAAKAKAREQYLDYSKYSSGPDEDYSNKMDEGWKEKVAAGALGAAALGGIGAGIAHSPMARVDGKQIHMAVPGKIPDNAELVTDDDGKKIYIWRSYPIKNSPGNTNGHLVYRPAEDVKEGVTEGYHPADDWEEVDTIKSTQGRELGWVLRHHNGTYAYYDERTGDVEAGFATAQQARQAFVDMFNSRKKSVAEGSTDLTDIWQQGREAAYKGKGPTACPYKMFSREYNAWQQGWQDQKASSSHRLAEADKHSMLGKIQRGHELKKKVDSTFKDISKAQQAGDHPSASKAFRKHERYANLERPGTWTKVDEQGVAEGYILKKTNVSKYMEPGDPDEYTQDVNVKDTDYEIINNKTGQVVGTASWTTNDFFGPGALKITMKNGATRWLDIWEREKGNPQSAFNRFVKDPKTSKKYKEQGVSEGTESSIEKKIRAKQDALSLAREQRRARGQRQQGQREIKLQAEIDRLNTELTQLKKQHMSEGWSDQDPEQRAMDATRWARQRRGRQPRGSEAIDDRLRAENEYRLNQQPHWVQIKSTGEYVAGPFPGMTAANREGWAYVNANPGTDAGDLQLTPVAPPTLEGWKGELVGGTVGSLAGGIAGGSAGASVGPTVGGTIGGMVGGLPGALAGMAAGAAAGPAVGAALGGTAAGMVGSRVGDKLGGPATTEDEQEVNEIAPALIAVGRLAAPYIGKKILDKLSGPDQELLEPDDEQTEVQEVSRRAAPEPTYDQDFQDKVARLKQLAGAGPLKTVWDPSRRVYRNIPVAQQPAGSKNK